ncbi:MAG: NADH-quinone oxidoreductase subunit I [Verrucomicrobiota bacterium]
MIVERKKLTWFERLYLPAVWGGFKVTARHFYATVFKGQNAAVQTSGGYHPEIKWKVGDGYRGAPYLVRDQEGRTKCVSCQLCEFICPPKAIKIIPPGPAANPETGNVEKRPREFEINMLRCIFCGLCQEVCPEEAIFLKQDYSLNGRSRQEMIYNKEKLLELGGVHQDQIMKWKNKAEEAAHQEAFKP